MQTNLHVTEARSFADRRVGLLNHGTLPTTSGLLLRKVSSLHTKGMAFAIDVVYLDRHDRIVHISYDLKPGQKRIANPTDARHALELASGALGSEWHLKVGDQLSFASVV